MGLRAPRSFRTLIVLAFCALWLASCGGGPEPAPKPKPKPQPKEGVGPVKKPAAKVPKAPNLKEAPLPAEKRMDFRVPDLTGSGYAEAVDRLHHVGLALGPVKVQTSKKAKGLTVKIHNPGPHSWIRKGGKVGLTLTGPEGPPVKTPDLTGKALKDAAKELAKAKLALGLVTLRAVKKGTKEKGVVAQSPGKAASTFAGGLVDVTVALPEADLKKVKVPAVKGKTLAAALRALYSAGFTAGPAKWVKDAKAAGKVVTQAPAGGKAGDPAKAVALSVGAANIEIAVPDLRGKRVAEATTVLGKAQLSLGSVKAVYGKAADLGKIISQEPKAGTKKGRGGEVAVTVVQAKANSPFAAVIPRLDVDADQPFQLNAATSKAYGGRSVKEYRWKRDGKALPEKAALLKEKGLKAGSYRYTLVVVDSLGLESKPATVRVTVQIPMVTVPNLTKKPLASAKTDLAKAGLVLGKVTPVPGKGTPGAVFSQNPAAGRKVKKGSTVALELGAEPEKVAVPNLAGKPLANAKSLLTKAGLTTGSVTQVPGKGKVGAVVGQKPAAGAKVPKGSAVALEVGAEKKPALIPVPNVVGKKLADAKSVLEKAGLVPGKVTQALGKGTPGVVFGQKPKAGTQVAKGLIIDLEVGAEKSPALVPVPNVVGKTLAQAKAALTKAGLAAGKVTEVTGKGKPGVVFHQKPMAGLKVAKGSGVALQVGGEAKKPEKPKMPNLIGKTLEDAREEIQALGLKVGKVTPRPGRGEPGRVIGQKPLAGSAVDPGAVVDLDVGEEMDVPKVRVPDLSGLTVDEAKSRLLASGLEFGRMKSVPGKGELGKVLAQKPAAGEEVKRGTLVSVEVGAPARVQRVATPGLKGLTLEEAKARLKQLGLVPGKITREIFSGKAGMILSQNPPAGRNVKVGSSIDLVVAREPVGELAEVPDLKGLKLSEAARKLSAIGLKVAENIENRVDNTVEPGQVLDQKPAAGKKVERGTEIHLVIAKQGEVLYTVPDVVGKPQAEAEEILRREGFGIGEVTSAPAPGRTELGTVLSQKPAAGEKTKTRVSVALVVAVKPETVAKVPGLVGLARARAEELLKEAGLALGNVTTEERENEAVGTVLRQTPEAGLEVPPGTKVDLVVAEEPADMVKVPIILRLSLEDAQKALEKAGLRLGTVTQGKRFMKEIVVRQFPYPNKKVRKGTKVDVTVTKR
ncbi:MAG: PASTA domain-containing protein [Planctomycetota bacterium]|jgi:beta-lactam-binding protein with PASTA domain